MKHDIFYTPREQYVGMPHVAMCGDFMPYYWQKEFYLYFLKDECVYLTRTKDFVSFSEARMVIERGGEIRSGMSELEVFAGWVRNFIFIIQDSVIPTPSLRRGMLR